MLVRRLPPAVLSLLILLLLAACSAPQKPAPVSPPAAAPAPLPQVEAPPPQPAVVVPALSQDEYRAALARHLARHNQAGMYEGRPQALLRAVIVVRYVVDSQGRLVRSEIMRSNRDRQAEAAALGSLRNATPFPPPSPHLLRRGQVELIETWLFNDDGRFQLRTTALPQMDR